MDELGAGIAQSRRTVALIKVGPHANPVPEPSWELGACSGALQRSLCSGHHLPPPPRRPPGGMSGSPDLAWVQDPSAWSLCPRKRAGWEGGVSKEWGQRNAVLALTLVPCVVPCRAQPWRSGRG